MNRIVLFDLDETLYAPGTGVMDCIRERMQAYVTSHLGVSEAEADDLRRRYLRDYGTTLRGLQINHNIEPEEYLRSVHDVPLDRLLQPNPVLDSALASIPLDKVVFTNSSREHAERVLALIGIRCRFSRIVDVRDVEYESKPQPAAYRRVCDLLGVRPQECILVEDSLRNLVPAKALGMTTVLVHDGGAVPAGTVDGSIRCIEEISDLLWELARDRERP